MIVGRYVEDPARCTGDDWTAFMAGFGERLHQDAEHGWLARVVGTDGDGYVLQRRGTPLTRLRLVSQSAQDAAPSPTGDDR